MSGPRPIVQAPPPEDQGIAIVGLSGRFPGAPDVETLWQRLRRGDETIERFPPEAVEDPDVTLEEASAPGYVRARGVLAGVDRFDAAFFGYSAREAEVLDPQLRVFLETAWHALEDAGYADARHRGLTGVYAGAGPNTYAWNHLAHHPELARTLGRYQLMLGNEKDFLATSVSFRLDLRGPSLTVQTACSTSLVAVHLAGLSLASYDCDLALAGGVSVQLPQRAGYRYEEGGILSPDGHCRAFDAEARGMVGGSGVGVVVLKRLADALADGDTVRAVILGSAINNDGALKVGYTAPSLEGQAEAVAAAQAVAGIDPATVSYVEAHGTGTPLGDPIEVAALTRVFRAATERRGFCALGSVKTNLGHLDAAAGVTGLIKAVLALERGEIPPSLHFRRPNPRLDLDRSPFYVPDRLVAWEPGETPRRAGVSSFGIGGTNAHVVLEEAAPVPEPTPGAHRPWQLLPLSAREPEGVEALSRRLAEHLESDRAPALADAAYTLQVGRARFDHRRVALGRDAAEAVRALRGEPAGSLLAGRTTDRERPVFFLVPGQGGRLAGAGREVYEQEPAFRAELDRCADRLVAHLGLDLRDLVYPAPERAAEAEARLAETRFAQPALFALSWASARLWASWGIEPAGVLGHSVGELVAACLGGLFALEDAIALVAERGRLMHGLPAGAMATVELSEEEVAPLLGEELSLAAVNAPRLVTVAGPAGALEALSRRLAAGCDETADEVPALRRLRTAHAFHSAAVDGVLDDFAAAVERVPRREPEHPWVSSLTGDWVRPDEARSSGYWARHLRHVVRFSQGVETLLDAAPAGVFVELGPGRSLGALLRRHPRGRERLSVATLAAVPGSRAGSEEAGGSGRALAAAVARLWLAGAELDWRAYAGPARRVPLPGYPFARRRYWIEGPPPLGGAVGSVVGGGAAVGGSDRSAASAPSVAAGEPAGNRHPRPDLPVPRTPPRDETEAALVEIWEELLGVAGIGIHDEFFELGGHSLLSLRVAARLEERFGVRLGTAAVGEAATVAAQAELLRSGPESVAEPGLLPLGAGARSLLSQGPRAGGAEAGPAPLVLVHPIGGGVLAYRELARRLGAETGVPILGLRAPGYETGEAPAESVEALARRHLETLEEALGAVPVRLGGWSFGGVVAFEMGRARFEQGGATGPILLVDSAPAPDPGAVPAAEAELVAAFARDLAGSGEVAEGPGPTGGLGEIAAAGGLDALLAAAVAAGLLPAGGEERVRRLFQVFRAHAAALAAYRPRSWPTDAVLVEAARHPAAASRPRDLWGGLVEGRLDVSELDADHYSILSPPAVERLAEVLAAALREPVGATHATGP